LVPIVEASASEHISYTYDARGRLIQVSRSGTVNDGVQANYSYDKADNRTNVTVVGSSVPNLSVGDVAVIEGAMLSFTVSRTGSTDSSISVNYATSDGTASASSDYAAATGTLTFAIGQATRSVDVATTDDAAVESSETVNLTLSGATGGATISDAQGVGTINDNDFAPSFTISSNASAVEGSPVEFTVTKSGTTTGTLTVDYATAAGTATPGTDFTATSGTLSFLDTDTTKTISVATTDDVTTEGNETFTVTISNAAAGSTITTPQGTGTINDNDNPPPSFAVNDVSVTEGGDLVLTVTKTGSTSSSFSVDYATANGTATAGTDYTATSGTLTFDPADATQAITIPTTGDTTFESDETFTVTLSNATGGATITDGQGVGTIDNDDSAPPSFAIDNATVTEGGNLVFTVTKTGSTTSSFSVSYATANSSASAGSDYTAASGTLTFTSAETSKPITISTINDTTPENDETMRVNLSGATEGATIADSQGIGTIKSDDVGFSINNASAPEGSYLTFTVTKTGTTSSTTSVNYATANGTATALDYYSKSGTLTFSASQTSHTILVDTKTDQAIEANETFKVNLSGASGGSITDSQGIGTIESSDAALMGQPAGGATESAPVASEPAPGEGETVDPPSSNGGGGK
jgi:hypothetical protein